MSVQVNLFKLALITFVAVSLVVFGDWPDGLSFIGLTLILVSGFGSLMLQKLS